LLEVRVVGPPLRFSPRVTQGCDKWLRLERDAGVDDCARALRGRGFRLYATVPGAALPLESIDAREPAAFWFGNEHAGLSARARALADRELALPLHGFSQSLNLSVAAALLLYTHAARRRAALGRAGDLDEQARLELRARYYALSVRGAAAIVARHRR
jgi:tRNA (guanosine-2'-O-)-methyltransferase